CPVASFPSQAPDGFAWGIPGNSSPNARHHPNCSHVLPIPRYVPSRVIANIFILTHSHCHSRPCSFPVPPAVPLHFTTPPKVESERLPSTTSSACRPPLLFLPLPLLFLPLPPSPLAHVLLQAH